MNGFNINHIIINNANKPIIVVIFTSF